jgi:SAM-dependent methyltransferase
LLLYAATIFLSAFLLFEVQPMIGRIILPWFGGSAAVWSTCLLFFQVSLLAGYLYAHWSTRYLKPRHQALLHLALMAGSIALLPILPSPAWKPAHPGDPSARILLLLAATIGLPYILLSTTTPLLQAWYVAAKPGALPYRLFALSNFGSLLALVSFPLLVEPLASTRIQAYGWSAVYAVFVVLCASLAWKALRDPLTKAPTTETSPARSHPRWQLQALWIALSACSSALLLAVTTHLTMNVAPIPLLWVATLGVYLASFIICFEREKLYHRAVFLPLLAIALGAAAYALHYNKGNLNIKWSIPIFIATLFLCCMACHGELARLKPDPRHLTSFYLMVALGGALGGLFVAVGAPHLFHTYAELPLALAACPALVTIVLWIAPGQWPRKFLLPATRIAMIVFTAVLAGYLVYHKHLDDQRFEISLRNYYGVLRVYDLEETADQTGCRKLIHGTINHGIQLTASNERRTPTSYYGRKSGMGRAIRYFERRSTVRVGVIGLGAGVTAAYGRPGDLFQFYELNPLDLSIATTWFTFLKDCPADHQVLLGDARLTLERQPSQQYDVLAVDAFTSDAIPVHLLTREAFQLYFRHLKPGGILAVHVSNRYLNLTPIVARHARDSDKAAILISDDGEDEDYLTESDWMLVTADAKLFSDWIFQSSGTKPAKLRPNLRPWTDDYSNLFQVLKR